jgi:hypothetical protein
MQYQNKNQRTDNQILNQQYVVKTLNITQSSHQINYSEADYWKINGSSTDCILNINFPTNLNTLSHLILEITKGSGIIQFGNLDNVVYNDGRAIELSGQGRTDLIGISHTSLNTIITMIGANLRDSEDNFEFEDFDKNNYPDQQFFSSPLIFDDFFKDTVLLLNFENTENFNWNEDQSLTSATITTVDVFNKSTDIYTLNKREYVAEFRNRTSSNLTVNFPQTVVLDGDFTYEFFIQYEISGELNTSTTQTYINTSGISLTYGGIIDYDNLSTNNSLDLTVGTNSFSLNNAIRIFKNNLNYYMHFALVRIGNLVYLFIDGIKEFQFTNTDTFNLNTIVTSGFKANLNSVRLTKRARAQSRYYQGQPRKNARHVSHGSI